MTSLYSKATDCHQYLHYKSSHIKRYIMYSQTLRVRRVCPQKCDFKEHGRWNSYKSKSTSYYRGEHCMQQNLCKHFESGCHSDFRDQRLRLIRLMTPTLLKDKRTGCEP